MSEFKVGDAVQIVADPERIGTVISTGLHSDDGIQWVEVIFNKRPRWMLADRLRHKMFVLKHVAIPDNVFVVKRPNAAPEVYERPGARNSLAILQAFADSVYATWAQSAAISPSGGQGAN